MKSGRSAEDFGYAFPFEGNGNFRFNCSGNLSMTLDTLSRLKGMETQLRLQHWKSNLWLWIRFPVWREWKLICICSSDISAHFTCDTLSRLKGIETFFPSQKSYCRGDRLAMCFPVGREWKPGWRRTAIFRGYYLRCAFPFEGNWNCCVFPGNEAEPHPCDVLSRLKGMETPFREWSRCPLCILAMRVPVGREWKLHSAVVNVQLSITFLWIRFPVWRE